MADLYRKAALDRISNPEQLDKTQNVTTPLSFLAYGAAIFIAVVLLIWAFVGSFPITTTANGVLAYPDSTNACFSDHDGTVVAVLISEGRPVTADTPVLQILSGDGTIQEITAGQSGIVSHLLKKADDTVKQGEAFAMISPQVGDAQLVAVCYVMSSEVKNLRLGQEVKVYLSNKDKQVYGYIPAIITNIDAGGSSPTTMSYVLGSNNNVASGFLADSNSTNTMMAVTCRLETDPGTASGYAWSNENGRRITSVDSFSSISVTIFTGKQTPFTKAMIWLAERF